MKKAIAGFRFLISNFSFLFSAFCFPSFSQPATNNAPSEDYQLVWADEFNQDGPLNPKDWGYENGFVRNQELQWYQPENAICKDGFLIIEARKESKPNPRYLPPPPPATNLDNPTPAAPPRGGRRGGNGWQNKPMIDYTAASVNTGGKHTWMYGRFEMRAKIDVRSGSWPAFWTLGVQGGWPANGEVDIMEYYRQMVLANFAWGGATQAVWNSKKTQLGTLTNGWADNFHVWRMDWDENSMKIYVDEELVNSQDLGITTNAPSRSGFGGRGGQAPVNPFHQPVYIMLNQAIGGQNGGDPSTTDFPVKFIVDYVRVYQKPSQRAASDPAAAPR